MGVRSEKNILVLGSGGREHAICWRLAQADKQHVLHAIPGNSGIASLAKCTSISLSDFDQIAAYCLQYKIDVVVVGPEQPLVDGIVDFFIGSATLRSISILGPDQACAQLEGSKAFSKAFMARHNIPTARYSTFERLEPCLNYLKTLSLPIVIKADGLAAGKGVVIATSLEEAEATVRGMLSGFAFGKAGEQVVIEEFLTGTELSYFVLADGNGHFVTLPQAKDYKRIGVGDTGPNTGGMGTISPVPTMSPALDQLIQERIVKPTFDGLAAEGLHYKGFLFIGLMIVGDQPYVIEYNCRMGDPETQSIMTRLGPDFADVLIAAAEGNLGEGPTINNNFVCTVVLASGGYPANFQKGFPISGIATINSEHTTVFHAGTALNENGELVNVGGRVLAVTSSGATAEEARALAQAEAAKIQWEGRYFRTDIGG